MAMSIEAVAGDACGRPSGHATLWVAGSLPAAGRVRVAVIGARAATREQNDLARAIGTWLTTAGADVWSGGAVGVDTAALQGALEAGGSPCAVLPGGIDVPFPRENAQLFEAIARLGAVLSCQPPGAAAPPARFLIRNLLVARLVDAVVAVCAEVRSGSLHACRHAWRLQRPVLATPWTPGTENSAGTNRLLASGARALATPDDARQLVAGLAAGRCADWLRRDPEPPREGPAVGRPPRLPIDEPPTAPPCYAPPAVPPQALPDVAGWSALERARLEMALAEAGAAGASVEALAAATGLDRSATAATLLAACLAGRIQRLPGGAFRR